MTSGVTPSQTAGPYVAIGLEWSDGPHVVDERATDAIWLRGRVLDGEGNPVDDGYVETWQADPEGRYPHPDDPRGAATGFRGFGRARLDDEGWWAVRTLKPGATPTGDGGWQAPHVAVAVLARGLLQRVVTRLYFPEEEQANAVDPVLTRLAPEERERLVARPEADGYRLDLHLQGPTATVFFDF